MNDYRPHINPNGCDLIFLSERGGELKPKHFYEIIVKYSLKYLGKRVNPHAYRHNVLTDVFDNYQDGKDGKLLMGKERLGHKDIRTTMGYYDKNEEGKQTAKFDEFVSSKKAHSDSNNEQKNAMQKENEELKIIIAKLENDLKRLKENRA